MKMNCTIVFVLILNVVLLVSGQVLWKYEIMKVGGISREKIVAVIGSLPFILGILFYGVATLIWLWILSKAPLSKVYPMQSFAYVLGVFAGIYIFKEKFSITSLIGIMLIILGITLIGLNK